MELNLRTVLVILGALVMLGILFDGFRRMRRARQEALKLDVKDDFKFPADSFSSELPNGGARVIDEQDLDELMDDAQTFRDQLHEFPHMSALDQLEEENFNQLDDSIKASLQEERVYAGEPDFQQDSYAFTDDATQQQAAPVVEAQDGFSENIENAELPVAHEFATDALNDLGQSPGDDEKPSANEHFVAKAKPLDLDEHVPLLMDVEELGEDVVPQHTAIAFNEPENTTSSGKVAEDAIVPEEDAGVSPAEMIELTKDDIPAIEATTRELANMFEEESKPKPAEDLMAVAAYTPVKKPGLNAECLADRSVPSLVLVTHVLPHDEEGFCGEDILYLVNSCDLRHGEKDIFHRFENKNGEGYIQFSMANSFNPGTFNPDTLLHERIHGVSLFMSLPGPENAMDAFEAMTEMAAVIGRTLGGDVYDETHSIMALQTIEHNRQQVRDFVRRQKLMDKK